MISDRLLWVDLETPGLKPGPGHAILEIALAVTDLEFNVLGTTSQLAPADTLAAYEVADAYVKQMHTENGLWAEHHAFMHSAQVPTRGQLEDYLISWSAGYGIFPGDKNTLFCNQGAVGVDNDYLNAYMPRVRALWGHRALDVSAWRDLVMAWYGCKYTDMPALVGTTHRALDDVLHTIEVAKWIKERFWVRQ